jgi:hypothetical protein
MHYGDEHDRHRRRHQGCQEREDETDAFWGVVSRDDERQPHDPRNRVSQDEKLTSGWCWIRLERRAFASVGGRFDLATSCEVRAAVT